MRLIVCLLILICSVFPLYAADSGMTSDQAVSRFLQRDLIGSRLSSADWRANMADLVGWAAEPGWDIVVVVESYKANPVQRAPDGLRAVVEYQVLGDLVDGQWLPRKKAPELQRVNFLLGRKDGHWLVKRPVQPPHISVQTAIGLLEKEAAAFQAEKRQAMLQESLKQLRSLQGSGS